MIDHDDITPTDRPLMRSDLDAVRKTCHGIQTFQAKIYEEMKRGRLEPRVLTAVCVACALVSISCAVAGLQ